MKNIEYFPIYTRVGRKGSVKNFIISIFNRQTRGWDDNDTFYCCNTYKNKRCTIIQCNGKRRSFEDLYRIVKTYYPSISIKRFHVILKHLHDNANLNFFYCTDIKNVVFLFYDSEGILSRDKKVNGFYSMNEILEIWENL